MNRGVRMVVVLACCIASVTLGSSVANASVAHAAAAAKGAPLRIGVVCQCSGATGAGQSSIKQFDEAWVKWTNARGGVNGHPVKLYFVDDGGDATRAASGVRRLINESKVQAIAGWFTTTADSWAGLAEKAGIPVIGSPGPNRAESTNAFFFPTGLNQVSGPYSMVNAAKIYNAKKVAVFYCAEAPVCAQLPAIFGGLSKLVGGGVSVVTSAKISGSQPSFAAQCLAAKSAGANSLFVASDAAVGLRVMQQCVEQGWKPFFLALGPNVGHNDGAALKGARLSLTTEQIGIEDTTTRGSKLFHQIIAKYAPGIPKAKGYNAGVGVVNASLQMFATAAKKAKLTPASKPSVLINGLYSLKGETLGGLIAPVTYTRGKPTFLTCVFLNTFNGQTWRANPKPQCPSAANAKALEAIANGG